MIKTNEPFAGVGETISIINHQSQSSIPNDPIINRSSISNLKSSMYLHLAPHHLEQAAGHGLGEDRIVDGRVEFVNLDVLTQVLAERLEQRPVGFRPMIRTARRRDNGQPPQRE